MLGQLRTCLCAVLMHRWHLGDDCPFLGHGQRVCTVTAARLITGKSPSGKVPKFSEGTARIQMSINMLGVTGGAKGRCRLDRYFLRDFNMKRAQIVVNDAEKCNGFDHRSDRAEADDRP